MDIYLGQYDNFLLAGDFNAQDTEPKLMSFLETYCSSNIVREPTCFKNVNNPSCIDLFITNKPRSFQNTKAMSCGISDFHKLVVTVLKTKFDKHRPKVIHYRDYRNVENEAFKTDLRNYRDLCTSYEDFEKVFLQVLDMHAPLKQKIVRANEAPYMTRQAMMRRSQLETKNEFDKATFKRQNNFVSKLYKK